MKVFNFIWGFALGAGIDKCFLTYTRLGEIDDEIELKNACIRIGGLDKHTDALENRNVDFIDIKSKKDFSWLNKLVSTIREFNPDVVFTHGFNGAIIMLILRVLKGIKVKCVFTYHGTYTAPSFKQKILEPLYNFLPVWIYKHLGAKTICVSENSKQQLAKCGVPGSKLAVVYNGLADNMNGKDYVVEVKHPAIMTASRIDEVKGLGYLLAALALLKEKKIYFHYYMLGEGPELENLRKLSSNLDLSECVEFAGFQSNIYKWLDVVDIFVLPSLKEWHSIALLEAMRAGKAIVASNVGGNPESIRDGIDGLLVPARDSKELAAALEVLLTDEGLRQKYSASARNRFKEEFTEEAMMRNIARVLEDAATV